MEGEYDLTYHIISILIFHHQLQGTGSVTVHHGDLGHDRSSLFVGSILNALLNNVGGELMLRKCQQLCSDNFDNLGSVIWSAMLDDMLSDIVAVLISDEHGRTLVKLLEDCDLIMWFAVLQDPLNDSTAVWMSCQSVNLTPECFNDELYVLGWDTFNGFLYNVVTILVLDTLENIGVQFLGKLGLLIGEHMFECLERMSLNLEFYDDDRLTF